MPLAAERQDVRRMDPTSDNETWVVDACGDVVEKRANVGHEALSPREQLLYWLWWADYMMRNAGDFANAEALDRDFQEEAAVLAEQLGFGFTYETFSLPRRDLQKEYFDRFDRVCDEIRNA